jgi:peptide/nickel transport system ATP-binding protein
LQSAQSEREEEEEEEPTGQKRKEKEKKEILLRVEDLSVDYKTPAGPVHALRNVSLSVNEGEVLSVVGESGSGKTTLALAIARLLPESSGVQRSGRILFRDIDVTSAKRSEMDSLRGTELFMIFQNPFMSLNPLMKIKDQIGEAIRVRNRRLAKKKGGNKGVVVTEQEEEEDEQNKKSESENDNDNDTITSEIESVLKSVRIADARDVMERYPHQLSGGQNQRVMLAMALAERPSLLIADEPTTALDVTTQAQVLSLLKEIIRNTGMSVIFITHDLAVAGSISDRIAVMYGGMVQEIGASLQILSDPKHPYTVSLINSIPSKTKKDGPLEAIKGSFSLFGLEDKCAFAPRCPLVRDKCNEKVPALISLGDGTTTTTTFVRCINYGEAPEDARV